jgi:hypothetical protein
MDGMSDRYMDQLIEMLENQFEAGAATGIEINRAKLDVAIAKAQIRTARYMLWSVVVATVAALISAATVVVPLLHKTTP